MPRPNGNGKKFNKTKAEMSGQPQQRTFSLHDKKDFVLLPGGDDENISPNKPYPKVAESARKRKIEKAGIHELQKWQKNFLVTTEQQVAARSDSKECLLRSLSTVSQMLEANSVALEESEQSLRLLMGNILKKNKLILAAHNQSVNAIKEIQQNHKKQFELQESQQHEASRAVVEGLAEKVNTLMEQLKENRRSQMEKLRQSMMYAMEFDI